MTTLTLVPGGLPATLSLAARAAAANNPADIVTAWLRSLAPGSAKLYRRALAAFAEWAAPTTVTAPEQVLALIAQLGAGRAHLLLCGYRDHLLETGRSTATAASAVSAVCSLVRVAKRAGAVPFTLDGIRIARELIAMFEAGKFDVAHLVAPVFKNALTQEPTEQQIFPVPAPKSAPADTGAVEKVPIKL